MFELFNILGMPKTELMTIVLSIVLLLKISYALSKTKQ